MRSELALQRVSVPYMVLLVGFVGLAVAVETAFATPVRLPGHRALPGALVLLLAAEGLAPLLLLALAAMGPALLAALGYVSPLTVGVYLLPAMALVWWYRKPLMQGVAGFILVGLAFGLLRYLSVSFGFHHTPEFVRLGSHLAFGALGGVAAFGAVRFSRRQS